MTPPEFVTIEASAVPTKSGMTLHYVDIIFQIIAFLFAISVHESAHAWMANLRGDPTARMLGRITLNPIKHIDPIGTVLLPLIAALTGLGLRGGVKRMKAAESGPRALIGPGYEPPSRPALISFGAVIPSFMTAVHWPSAVPR